MEKSESSDCNQIEVEWEIIDLWQDHHFQYSHSSHHVGRDEERPPQRIKPLCQSLFLSNGKRFTVVVEVFELALAVILSLALNNSQSLTKELPRPKNRRNNLL